MMEWLKSWLMGIIVLSVLCGAADGLMPEGGIRKVGRLVCATALLCVMLRPISVWRGSDLAQYIREYSAMVSDLQQDLEEQNAQTQKAVIEEQCGAYIADKAAQMGIVCSVEVDCQPNAEGIWLPERVQIRGHFSDVDQSRMTEFLDRQLGVEAEDQSYFLNGEEDP